MVVLTSGEMYEDMDMDTFACSPEDSSNSLAENTLLHVPDRRTQAVVDPEGRVLPVVIRKTLHALLAALYVRQSNLSQMVLVELTALLKDTDFFEDDLRALPLPGTITMLDLTIEAVCDRVDSFMEHEHQAILQFFRVLVQHSCGRLSVHSQQKLFRCLSFLYSSYSSKSSWMAVGLPHPCADGGGDLLALKVFKELTWATVAQVETVDIAHSLPDAMTDTYDYSSSTEAFELARSFVIDLIEDVIDSLEVSRISEAAHMTIAKPSSSTTSALFWMQIGAISCKMFTENALRSAFLALCAICKLAWHGLRPISDGNSSTAPGTGANQASARDLGCKLLALETLHEFCASAGEKMTLSKVMGYQIRRLVVPCLLANLQYAILDHRVFSKVRNTNHFQTTALLSFTRLYLVLACHFVSNPALSHDALSHAALCHVAFSHGALCHGALSHAALCHGALCHGALSHAPLSQAALCHGALSHGALCHGALSHAALLHHTLCLPALLWTMIERKFLVPLFMLHQL